MYVCAYEFFLLQCTKELEVCPFNDFMCQLCLVWFGVFQGVDASPEGLKLISEIIRGKLGITTTVLMGANIANEVADEKFCETTIGMEDRSTLDEFNSRV